MRSDEEQRRRDEEVARAEAARPFLSVAVPERMRLLLDAWLDEETPDAARSVHAHAELRALRSLWRTWVSEADLPMDRALMGDE